MRSQYLAMLHSSDYSICKSTNYYAISFRDWADEFIRNQAPRGSDHSPLNHSFRNLRFPPTAAVALMTLCMYVSSLSSPRQYFQFVSETWVGSD